MMSPIEVLQPQIPSKIPRPVFGNQFAIMTRLMAQQDCLFKAGHNNNLVARHYGRDIFSYIEPSGRRYCR